ncbi:hypothetical protein [Leeia aquatica]|uniref:Uncharacterized protein n=1 Tax=Leeia aquatica TaxID=2725557 RepID=A0A847SBY0_9NEIS|nr:hypothetical protein [Leeia aquatica]NLR75016.1 hypothetical protein [Leeia aquatica]
MNLFDDNICHLTFSHTDCADVWRLYFSQMHAHFSVGLKHFVAVNEKSGDLPENVTALLYDEKHPYPQRLMSSLEALVDYDYVFFDHEDMFLYASPDYKKLAKYYELMRQEQFDHIRLIKGGDCIYEPVPSCPSLYALSLKSKWIFSIQPSFWRRTVLMDVLKANLAVNIWDLEVNSQKVVKRMGLRAAFSYRAGKRRGLHHFDNDVYPYIATAIGKGKWNLGEYGTELEPLLEMHHIDPAQRGWF